ncbi:MAG: putative ABC transporter permease [Deltaproteobacteria bacterium]
MKRLFILGFIMGMVYFTLEGFWRGWTNIAMLFIGGFCGVIVGSLNEYPDYMDLKVWQQTLLAWPLVLIVEFVSGWVLNIRLGLQIWDYSGLPGSIYGQVSLPYALLWLPLIPFAIWLDDWLRWKLFDEEEPPTLVSIYLDLIKLK